MMEIEFAYKWVFLLLLAIPLLIWRYIYQHRKRHVALSYSTAGYFAGLKPGFKHYLKHITFSFYMLALAGLIVAMARPQSSTSWQNVSSEGIDIVIALDISSSMLAMDLKPNRLDASKAVALDFIEARQNDRIGLVVYAGESFTQCPLTTDHSVLKNLFNDIEQGMIADGTAIGSGLSTAVSRLKESEAKSKVVILLTDGSNNRGDIPPITAAEIAKTFGIRVYTIGVGTNGMANYPMRTFTGQTVVQKVPVKIDENTLKEIAKLTDGKYFRATDNEKLKAIYNEIDQLEKSKQQVTEFRNKSEEFRPFLYGSLLLLTIGFILNTSILKSIF